MKRYYFYDVQGKVLWHELFVTDKEAKYFEVFTGFKRVGIDTPQESWNMIYKGEDYCCHKQIEIKIDGFYALC